MVTEVGNQRYTAEVNFLLTRPHKTLRAAGGDLQAVGIEKLRLDLLAAPLQSRQFVLKARHPRQVLVGGKLGIEERGLGRAHRRSRARGKLQGHALELQRMLARLLDQLLMFPGQRVDKGFEAELLLNLRMRVEIGCTK